MNQYIGARYVPKFSTWVEENNYEPLTIVRYGNANYISKTNVPAGISPTNEQYWALYSIISGGNPGKNNQWYGKNVVWVVDSWGNPNFGPILYQTMVSQTLHFGSLQIIAQSSGGYVPSPTFLEGLTNANILVGDDNVDVVILDGTRNDPLNYNQVKNAQMQVVTYIRNRFSNAEIIAIPAICNDNLSLPANSNWYKRFSIIAQASRENGLKTILQPLLFLGTTGCFQEDHGHLSQQGNFRMAEVLSQALNGNEVVPIEKKISGYGMNLQIYYLQTQVEQSHTFSELMGVTIQNQSQVIKANGSTGTSLFMCNEDTNGITVLTTGETVPHALLDSLLLRLDLD